MRYFIAPLMIALLHGHMADAQHITFERSYDYGYAEAAYAVIQTADGGYLMGGRQGFAPFYSEGLLIKTDAHGIEQWHNTFWAGSDTYIRGVDAVRDSIGEGYVITGVHGHMGMGANVFLARTDEFGDTLWLKTFGTVDYDSGWRVKSIPDTGYVIATTWGATQARLMRTDLMGDTVWEKTFLPEGADGAEFRAVSLDGEGGFYACGTVHFPDPARENMLYVVRVDAHGNLIWEKWLGGPENDIGTAVTTIPGGGVYAAGFTWSFGAGHYDMYLIRLTEDGDTLWTTTVGSAFEETAVHVLSTNDGGAVLVGTGSSGPGVLGQYGLMIAKVDGSGELLWTKRHERDDQESMHGTGGVQTHDNGFAICGRGHGLAYLIKTDDTGSVVGIDGTVGDSELPGLHPNPATEFSIITFPASWSAKGQLTVTVLDMAGKAVFSTDSRSGSNHVVLPVSHLSPGMYVASIHTSGQQLSNLKFIVR